MVTQVEAKGIKPGDLESLGQPLVKTSVNAYNNQAFAAGDVLALDKTANPPVYKKCTSGDTRPFAVCYKAKATTDARLAYVDDEGVYVVVVADGAINPDMFVKPSTSTDGRVVSTTETSTSTGIVGSTGVVGQFIKVAKWVSQGDGYTARVAAAQGDYILIKLSGV